MPAPTRSLPRRAAAAALAAFLVAGIAGLAVWRAGPTAVPPAPKPAAAPVAPPVPLAAAPDAPAPKVTAPAFDVVLVSPDGAAVIAGRAEAGALVSVTENGRVVAEVSADSHGTWVAAPDTKLPPGAGELTLTAKGASGTAKGDTPVLVMVPAPQAAAPASAAAAPPAPAMAVAAPPSGPSRLLQSPSAPGRRLGVDTVDYDEHGAIQFSGKAPSDAGVRAYVDNHPAGDAIAGTDGHWTMSPSAAVQPGVHTLRLDQVGPDGQVVARVELPFQRETLALSQVAAGQVVVQPGQNLWRLARRVYGTGIRYTVIFRANRDQIRDPRRIYPGQVFNTPGAAPPAAAVTPAAAR